MREISHVRTDTGAKPTHLDTVLYRSMFSVATDMLCGYTLCNLNVIK